MSFVSFIKNAGSSIGNAFKTGYNNGNLAKGMAIGGQALFTAGMTSAMMRDMSREGSVFGSGCCHHSHGYSGFGAYSSLVNDPYLNHNPMAITDTWFGQQYMNNFMG